MCVICVAASERPTEEMVAKMYADNPHGAGIAWREEVTEGKKSVPVVAWKKGLDEESVQELVAKVPLPFVVHFRIPSCGGPGVLLTHPFPIEKDVPLALEGTTKGSVLFHNGHWGMYRDKMLEASIRGNHHIPAGRWSDSRSMAWMAAHFGVGMLEFINEKVCVFGPVKNDIELFGESGWSKVGTGIWVSNKGWEHKHVPGFNRAASSTGKSEKKDEAAAESDKEEPSRAGQDKTVAARTGGTQALTTQRGTEGTGKGAGNGGALLKGRPFDSYMAAVRLFKEGSISHNSYKKAYHTYEVWCHRNKTQPLPRVQKWERSTVH